MSDNNIIIDKTINDWAEYWFYNIGVNIIPFDSKNKQTFMSWLQYQNNPIPYHVFEQWKNNNEFTNGIAIITGRIWRGPYKNQYLIGIDCDNKKAIEEICLYKGKNITIEKLAKWTIVEQHLDDPNRAHIYIRSTKAFKKKSNDKVNSELLDKIGKDEIPQIEVKGLGEHGVMIVSPSIHKNGHQYTILDTSTNPSLCDEFELHIDDICRKYGISYLESNNNTNNNYNNSIIPIEDLFKPETRILEGHNRHEALLRVIESLLQRNKGILSVEKIKEFADRWNQEHCNPPLDNIEFEKQWKDALKFIQSKNKYNNKKEKDYDDNNYDDNKENDPLDLIKEQCIELFVDQYRVPHVTIKINDHVEIWSLSSKRLKNLFFKICYDKTGKISNEKIENIMNILQAEAITTGNIKYLDLRVGKINDHENCIFYYDLTDSKWRVVEITSKGWSIIENNIPIMFKRYNNQHA